MLVDERGEERVGGLDGVADVVVVAVVEIVGVVGRGEEADACFVVVGGGVEEVGVAVDVDVFLGADHTVLIRLGDDGRLRGCVCVWTRFGGASGGKEKHLPWIYSTSSKPVRARRYG